MLFPLQGFAKCRLLSEMDLSSHVVCRSSSANVGKKDMSSFLHYAELLASSKFGFHRLRNEQKQVLKAIFSGQDCFAMMPTGSGKSYCYAIPSLMFDGLTIVISPLIALIRDQVSRFQRLGVRANFLDSLQSPEQQQGVWLQINKGELSMLFVSPERLSRDSFRERLLRSTVVRLIAVDEAHCISQWGQHFRPEYRKIGNYLKDFHRTPRLALTATATQRVRQNICNVLSLNNPVTIGGSFWR